MAKACTFTKSDTPPWVFFTFFKLYKWCQIAQRTSYVSSYNAMYVCSLKMKKYETEQDITLVQLTQCIW